jgi:hypothetical protein
MAKPKAKSKKMSPTDPVEEEEKAKAEVEAELRPKKEEENLGKASPMDISDTRLVPFSRQVKKHVEDEKNQLLHGSTLENVHQHSDAGRYASPDLCKVFEGYPQPEATNTRDGQARVYGKMQCCYP